MALSHDVIRVVPSQDCVAAGYLFAFLSSTPAQAMIRQRTYGSVVQHIEPHHLSDVPVPVPDGGVQERIHALVDRAAAARTEASQLLDEAATHFNLAAGPMPSRHHHARAVGVVHRNRVWNRLDAFHHVGWAAEPSFEGDSLDGIANVWSVSSMKRVFAPNGVPFASGTNIFDVRPTPENLLARWAADEVNAYVERGDILVQAYGQLNGLVGRPAHVGEREHGWAAGHLLFRVRTDDAAAAHRVFGFLRSESGRRSLLRHSSGNQIPHLVPDALRALKIPTLPVDLSQRVARALELREQADRDEEQAVKEVEDWFA